MQEIPEYGGPINSILQNTKNVSNYFLISFFSKNFCNRVQSANNHSTKIL